MKRVFLSHSRADQPFADRLVSALGERGIEAVLDRSIVGENRVDESIKGALRQADALLVVLSAEVTKDAWVNREVVRWLRDESRPVIPILLEDWTSNAFFSVLADRRGLDVEGLGVDGIAEEVRRALGIPRVDNEVLSTRSGGYSLSIEDEPDGCFPAETEILMADATTRPIAELAEGDEVAVATRYIDRLDRAVVVKVVHYPAARYLTINRALRMTASHPLLVNRRWLKAGNLRLDDHLSGPDGYSIRVDDLSAREDEVPVYNLVLDPPGGGFFADGFLVKNVTDPPTLETAKSVRSLGPTTRGGWSVEEETLGYHVSEAKRRYRG